MKKTSSIPILLFTASFFLFFTNATFAQQTVPEEKKRAMHKLDPIDIFPQVQERGDQGRNRDKRASNNEGSTVLANESERSNTSKTSRRNSRRKDDSPETSAADLAGNVAPSPTPLAMNETASTATTGATADLSASVEERTNPVASSQTLAAMNTSALPSNVTTSKDQTLPLPVTLALLALVLVMLVLVFTRLIRYLRNPVS
jgi:cobalamin biosynthesis Mg chelatase CobN